MRRRIVLVGGGHAHALVLARWRKAAPDAVVTLVTDEGQALYSGMVPGLVAGQYRARDLGIDLVALARDAGAQLVLDGARDLDAAGGRLLLRAGLPIPFDLLSFDVGSTVAGEDVPGLREHALATRPLRRLVADLPAWLERVRARAETRGGVVRVAIVGAGAAGVEIALTLHARLARDTGAPPALTLVDAAAVLLGGATPSLAARVASVLAARGIEVRLGVAAAAVTAAGLALRDGDTLPADGVVWATGAAPHAWLRHSGLAVDARGYLRARDTLQVLGHDAVFGAGDCIALDAAPGMPKAGVYAVRAAPVLAHNLEATLRGAPLRRFAPQRDFLRLLNEGDGRAVGAKWGLAFEGRWVWRLKDRIDRRFVDGLRRG